MFWFHCYLFNSASEFDIYKRDSIRLGAAIEEPTFRTREEDDEEDEEEEQALMGKEDLVLRVDGTTSRERLMGITALVGGTTRPWYSKSLKTTHVEKAGSIKLGFITATAKQSVLSSPVASRCCYSSNRSHVQLYLIDLLQKTCEQRWYCTYWTIQQPLSQILFPITWDISNCQSSNNGTKLKDSTLRDTAKWGK